jgi:hypothetical protein
MGRFMTTVAVTASAPEYGPWNPGIQSQLPSRLQPLATIYRPENVFRSYEQVRELRDLTGLEFDELVVFRPERLVVHEVLIRVTGELTVPDGSEVDDLGVSFRQMTRSILTKHIAPHMPEIVSAYRELEHTLSALINAELSSLLGPRRPGPAPVPAQDGRRRGPFSFLRWHVRERKSIAQEEDDGHRAERVLARWADSAGSSQEDPLATAAYQALIRVSSAVRARHGRIWGDAHLLGSVATGIACNQRGAEMIGELADTWFRRAIQAEGYSLLPFQERPVVINTKGASASGKSTMRPYQKRLAAETGIDWHQFALISPDIWRQYLLDFRSLGDNYKYAGMFTGDELAIVDKKLDSYMGRKGERAEIPHILIDRFRWDSFASDVDETTSTLITRFAELVYLFFMITPPHATVERAWQRGLRVGRYKAVDDLLAHNVEAFTGMPDLFFTWALRTNKRVHYEFLDNSVPHGERPRTVAFGWNREMTILDVNCLLDVERYKKINVNASCPDEVYPDSQAMAPENNTQFLLQCVRRLTSVSFARRETGRVYARIESGRPTWIDPEPLEEAMMDRNTQAGIMAVTPGVSFRSPISEEMSRPAESLEGDRMHILGQWGCTVNV